MDFKNIQKQLPPTIPGHYGQLTIMKHKAGNYYCMYPQIIEQKVPVIKGKSIEQVCKRMHRALVEIGLVQIEKRNKKKKEGVKRGPMPFKKKMEFRLKKQKITLNNK